MELGGENMSKTIIKQSTKQGLRQGYVINKKLSAASLVRGFLMRQGMINTSGDGRKPKISEVLLNTHIPQIIGEYSDPHGACAMGMLFIEAGMPYNGKDPNWTKFFEFYNVTYEDINARVECPHCGDTNSIAALIPHLNDTHEDTPQMIGSWLQQYGL